MDEVFNYVVDPEDGANAPVDQCKGGCMKFLHNRGYFARRIFSKKNVRTRKRSNFSQKIFLRISERNEYAIRQTSVSAIRFDFRVCKNSKNLNDAAFIPNG